MGRLETFISGRRINKAINKVEPRDKVMERRFIAPVFGLIPYNYSTHDIEEYSISMSELEKRRGILIDKINREHRDWFNKAPKTNAIVAYLRGKAK